jgi:hypothetical protein
MGKNYCCPNCHGWYTTGGGPMVCEYCKKEVCPYCNPYHYCATCMQYITAEELAEFPPFPYSNLGNISSLVLQESQDEKARRSESFIKRINMAIAMRTGATHLVQPPSSKPPLKSFERPKFCLKCGNSMRDRRCPKCGTTWCAHCGTWNEPNHERCSECDFMLPFRDR